METNALNSPELEPAAPKPSNRINRLSAGWWLLAVVIGVATGAVGTVMHLNSYWTGSFGIPWGVILALAIAGLGQWWTALASASMLAPGITGIAQYTTLAVMSGLVPGEHFGVPISTQTWALVPHLVIATLLWHIGVIVLTLVTVTWMKRQLPRMQAME